MEQNCKESVERQGGGSLGGLVYWHRGREEREVSLLNFEVEVWVWVLGKENGLRIC